MGLRIEFESGVMLWAEAGRPPQENPGGEGGAQNRVSAHSALKVRKSQLFQEYVHQQIRFKRNYTGWSTLAGNFEDPRRKDCNPVNTASICSNFFQWKAKIETHTLEVRRKIEICGLEGGLFFRFDLRFTDLES